MKQSSNLSYTYRLGAARLVILRLRMLSRWDQLFTKNPSVSAYVEPGNRAVFWMAGFITMAGLSGAAILGYTLGQRAGGDAVLAAVSMTSDKSAPVPEFDSESDFEQPDPSTEATRVAELSSLQQTVHTLQSRIQSLEQEATSLEVELLDQQLVFAKEQARWEEAAIEHRVVYNITNIPVGGSLSLQQMATQVQPERIEAAGESLEYQDQPVAGDPYNKYRVTDSAQEQWNGATYLADVLEQ